MFATKKITAADLDEVGLSVLIKSCDRLGDAEWAVTILKEAIKAVSGAHSLPRTSHTHKAFMNYEFLWRIRADVSAVYM